MLRRRRILSLFVHHHKENVKERFPELLAALRRIPLVLNREQKKVYALSIFFMLVSSILELFALGAFVPFIGIIASPSLLQHSSWGLWIAANIHSSSVTVIVLVLGGVLLLLFAGKNIVGYRLFSYENRFVFSIATEISRRKAREYYSMSFLDFQKSNTAELLQKTAYVPVEFAQHVVLGSMTLLSEGTILLLFVCALLLYRAGVFLLIAGTLVPLAVAAWYFSSKVLRRTRKTIQEESPANLKRLADALSGYQEVRLYGKEEYFIDRYIEGQRELNSQLGKLNTANIIPARLSEIFAVAGILLLLFFNSVLDGSISPSALSMMTVYVAFAYRAIPSVNKILNAIVHLSTYSFTAESVPPAAEHEKDVSDTAHEAENAPVIFRKSIEVRDVSFSYPGRADFILDHVSLTLHKGETIGLAGRSGLGKTTFVRILMQLLKQSSGEILVDGKVLQNGSVSSWHRLFSYVTQDPVILADTIEANVAYGVPSGSIDAEKMKYSLLKSGLSDFVAALPDGVRTYVGDQGKQLSGGQRQRLIIARALYRNSEIYVFDEATSQLDFETEQDILETITLLRRSGKTIVIISQKEQALTGCSRVYSLARGTIRLRTKLKISRRRKAHA